MNDTSMFYTVTALAAAGAAVYFFMTSRGRTLNSRPRSGTILDSLEGVIRLRDVFRLASTIEEEGIVFYRGLAEKANDPAVKALCVRLAEDEAKHKALLEDQLGEWRQLPANKLISSALLEQARQKGIFTHPPGPEAAEKEIAAYALLQEIKTAEFYQAFENAFPQAWKRAHMHLLVLEEKKHEQDLRTVFRHLSV